MSEPTIPLRVPETKRFIPSSDILNRALTHIHQRAILQGLVVSITAPRSPETRQTLEIDRLFAVGRSHDIVDATIPEWCGSVSRLALLLRVSPHGSVRIFIANALGCYLPDGTPQPYGQVIEGSAGTHILMESNVRRGALEYVQVRVDND